MFDSPLLSRRSARILPWLVAFAFFMQMLDSTILNTALPGIAADMRVSPLRMQAALIAYMLTTALFMPASGFLADRFGARRVFFFAILIFSLGSLLCALSPSLGFLVLARVVQGVGGSLLVPVGRLVVLKAYPRDQFVQVLSFVSLPSMIGPLMGPAVGGFLVEYASWHWIFLINLPVGLAGLILAARHMPDLKSEKPHRFDGVGFALFSLSMVMLALAMEGFGELRLPRVQSTLLITGGLILLCTYWFRAMHTDDPLFSPRLFRIRSFSVGIMGNLFARLASGAMPFLLPLFLQLGLGFSPFLAGLTMMPSALGAIAGKRFINGLLQRFGFRLFLGVNTCTLAGLVMALPLVAQNTPYGLLCAFLILYGAINGMQFTAMNSLTLIGLDNENAASGNSLLSVTMQISASSGVAIGAALLGGFTAMFGPSPSPIQEMQAFRHTFLLVGLIGMASGLIFAQAPPRQPPDAV